MNSNKLSVSKGKGWKESKHPTEKSPDWACACAEHGTGLDTFKEHTEKCKLWLQKAAL